MSKRYKILPQWEGLSRGPHTAWHCEPNGEETGESFGPEGLITLWRSTALVDSRANLLFMANGRKYLYIIKPRPTRIGLVRLARKLLRDALGESS